MLYGLDIQRYLRIGPDALRRWRRKHGLPVGRAPSGILMISKAQLDRWITARYREEMRQRNGQSNDRPRSHAPAD